jgi:hypothetical protein
MNKKYNVLFLSFMFFSPFLKASLSSVLVSYEQALQDFIKSHQELNPTKPIALTQSSVIFSTYSKIITPYVSYVSGYGRIVGQEFARKFPYHQDLLTMSDEFFKYDKEVKRIALFFPKDQQAAVVNYFYEQLTNTVVQVCYQIIKEISYSLSSNSQDLASVYVAYNLAWAAQIKDMQLTGLAQGADFKTSITKLMVTLYQAAVSKRTHSLEFDAKDASKSSILSKEINAYQEILYHVYSNAGQADQAAKQLLAIKGFKAKLAQSEKYEKDFGTAKKLPTVAQVIAQSAQAPSVDPSGIPALQAQATSNFAQAQEQEKLGNFASAMTQYGLSQAAYLKLLSAPSLAADENSNKSQYFLAKTRWTASSLASSAMPLNQVTFAGIANVPTSYVINVYEPAINVALLSSTMPVSLQSLPLSKLSSSLTSEQKKDVLQLFKAFLVSQIVSDQSISFAECFSDYTLTLKTGISSVNKSIADQALSTVNEYMKDFTPDIVSSLEMTSATSMTALFLKMPIPAVTPIYSSGICAADYFVGARSLFEQGTSLISLYGSTYVPGDDTLASTMMIESLAYAYSSAAQSKLNRAKSIIQEVVSSINASAKSVIKSVKSTVKSNVKSRVAAPKVVINASEKNRPANFSILYAEFKKAIIQSQSLLVAQDSSAQAYFLQAGLKDQAQAAQQAYVSLYQISIDFAKQCLVGDPTSAEYNSLLLDINTSYLQWASGLNPTLQAAQIATINQNIVNLFVVSGDQCLQFSAQESIFPGFNQFHYYSAAQRYLAAKKQYTSMENLKMAQATQDKISYAYSAACDQSIELYFYVKNHGLSYKASSTGQLVPISFDQMCKDYSGFEQLGTAIDPGEIHAYNTVQNLLFLSVMLYQYLSGLTPVSQTLGAQAARTKSVVATSQQKVLNYLIANKILEKTATSIPYMQPGIKEKILQIAPAAYNNFKSDPDALSSWFNILIEVVQNLYMQDYLGASASESSTLLTTQTKEFFDAVQKEGSSMQNPSSAYIA